MSTSPTRRAGSFRKGLDKFSNTLHLHRDGSLSPRKATPAVIPKACQNEEEAICLMDLCAEMQKRGLSLPSDMIYAGDLESTLMRFARARKYDVDKICIMIENTINWRKENKIDQILFHPMDREKLQCIRKCKPASYIGFDKQGKPVYIDRLGKLDVKGVEAAGLKEEDLVHYHIQEMEYMGRILMREAADRVGHTVDSVAMIMDVEGVTLTSFTPAVKSLTKKLLAIDSDNYPETNGGTWIVNASFVFSTIWRFVQPFLDARTRSKITVCANNSKTKAILADIFGKELLPTFMGGEVDFEEAQKEWAGKMDTALEECTRQYKETGTVDTSKISLGIAPTKYILDKERSNSMAASFNRSGSVLNHSSSLNSSIGHGSSFGTGKSGLAPLLLRQQSSLDDGDEFYTPRSTLSRAGSTVSSFDADSALSPDGCVDYRKANLSAAEVSSALQGLVKAEKLGTVDKQQSLERGERRPGMASLETIVDVSHDDESSQRPMDETEREDLEERERDLAAQRASACKCTIM